MAQALDKEAVRRLQTVLAARFPEITIDGHYGDQTRRLAYAALDGVAMASGAQSTRQRLLVAAGQAILNAAGFEAGHVDGWWGHNTEEALAAWEYHKRHGRREVVERRPVSTYRPPDRVDIPRERDMIAFYGEPGDAMAAKLVSVTSPYPLRLAWDLGTTITRVRMHALVAAHYVAAKSAVLAHYGLETIQRLGLDLWGGIYNPRKKRGGTSWSTHALAISEDIDPARNGLRTRCPEAQMCRPEYRAYLDIMEAHGWLPAIRLWGADGMHFQQARL